MRGVGLVGVNKGLMRDDFEDALGNGNAHKSVGTEHQDEQTALPSVIGYARRSPEK